MKNAMSDTNKRISVAVRIRPPLEKCSERYELKCAKRVDETTMSVLKLGGLEPGSPMETTQRDFAFDYIFDDDNPQIDVYNTAGSDMVDCVLEGHNATIFAYGQTGSGKTFTVLGEVGKLLAGEKLLTVNSGLFLRILTDLFEYRERCKDVQNITIVLSALEIYVDEVRDLLANCTKLKVRDFGDETTIPNLTRHQVRDLTEVYKHFQVATSQRAVTAHALNDVSSRSHAAFLLDVIQHPHDLPSETVVKMLSDNESSMQGPAIPANMRDRVVSSRITICDLAGSERVKLTGVHGQALVEARSINKSLFTLKLVVKNMYEGARVQYRDSQLTRILKQSFTDQNSKVLVICNIAPTSNSYEQSLNTLRFADEVKNLKVGNVALIDPVAEQEYLNALRDGEELSAEIALIRKVYSMSIPPASELHRYTVSDVMTMERKRMDEEQRRKKDSYSTVVNERVQEWLAEENILQDKERFRGMLAEAEAACTALTNRIESRQVQSAHIAQLKAKVSDLRVQRSQVCARVEQLEGEVASLRSLVDPSRSDEDAWVSEVRSIMDEQALRNEVEVLSCKLIQLRQLQCRYFETKRQDRSTEEALNRGDGEQFGDEDTEYSSDGSLNEAITAASTLKHVVGTEAEDQMRDEIARLGALYANKTALREAAVRFMATTGVWVRYRNNTVKGVNRKLSILPTKMLLWVDREATGVRRSNVDAPTFTTMVLGRDPRGPTVRVDLGPSEKDTPLVLECCCVEDWEVLVIALIDVFKVQVAWEQLPSNIEATLLSELSGPLREWCVSYGIFPSVARKIQARIAEDTRIGLVGKGTVQQASPSGRRKASATSLQLPPEHITVGELRWVCRDFRIDILRVRALHAALYGK